MLVGAQFIETFISSKVAKSVSSFNIFATYIICNIFNRIDRSKVNFFKLFSEITFWIDYSSPIYRVEIKKPDGDWILIRSGIKPLADRLEINYNHTRFHSDDRQDISFPPIKATAVRLVVEKNRSKKPREISEIQLSEDLAVSDLHNLPLSRDKNK